MQVPLFGGTAKGLSFAMSPMVFENCYEVPAWGTRNTAAIIGSPGTDLLATGAGACRGVVVAQSVPYFVSGTTLYQMSSSYALTSRGTVAGAGRVSMAVGDTQIVIVTGVGGTGYVYTIATNTLAAISDADFTGADTVTYQDGYFIFSDGTNQWFISEIDDGSVYSALDFVSNERSPDKTLAVISDHAEVFCFGQETIEVWINAGELDFPFIRNNAAAIERGTCAKFSIAKDDNSIFFLGNDRIVYRLEGYTPVRVSSDAVDTDLCRYTEAQIGEAFAFVYTDHGHKFYVLTVPGYATHVLNIATGSWHKRKKYTYDYWHLNTHVWAYGKHICGSSIDGKIFELNRSFYDDDGDTLILKHISNITHDQGRRFAIPKIQYIIESGVGLATGQGSAPVLMMRLSKDDGRTYGVQHHLPMGVMGDYGQKCIKRTCGSARTLCIETTISDPVKRVIVDAYIEAA